MPALDGVRGLAVLAVLWLHTDLFPAGWIGVDMFFVLSGYLITSILITSRASTDSRRAILVPFYVRRTLRIWPPAFLLLAVILLVLPAMRLTESVPWSTQWRFWAFLANVRLVPDPPSVDLLGHYWSLAMEEQFYLVWPWIVLAVSPSRMRAFLRVAVALPLLTRMALLFAGHPGWITGTGLRLDGLLWGAFVAYGAMVAPPWPLAVGGAVVAVWLSWGPVFSAWQYALAPLAVTSTTALVIAAIRDEASWTRWLAVRPLPWVGGISYALYLVHVPIALGVHRLGLAGWANLAVTLPVSLGLAALSWSVFESRILRHKRSWPMPSTGRRLLTRSAPAGQVLDGLAR